MRSRAIKTEKKRKSRKKLDDPRGEVALITDEPKVGLYGEVFNLSDTSGQTPVSGGSYYIFLDQTGSKVTLLHPFSLEKFTMDTTAFRTAMGPKDWNPTPAKLAAFLNKMVDRQKSLKRMVENYLILLIQHYAKLAEESI
jgi:hypothetical protein